MNIGKIELDPLNDIKTESRDWLLELRTLIKSDPDIAIQLVTAAILLLERKEGNIRPFRPLRIKT